MKSAAFCITTVVVFVVYAWASAPGIGLVDSGELTTAAWCLGIAHPTGYPLYTVLGHLWQAILPLRADRSMVLFSAAAGAVACGILMLAAQSLLEKTVKISPKLASALAAILVAGLAFSSSALGAIAFAEVYPLTFLIAALLLWSAGKVHANSSQPTRWAMLTAYLWGLGLGNHLTILWFFPVVLFAVLRTRPSVRNLLRCAACTLLGASINLYLPLRSDVGPLLNWGQPDTWDRLTRHLSAWQYREWIFSEGWRGFIGKLIAYIGGIPADIGWGLAVLAVIGMVAAGAKRSWLAAALIATWAVGTTFNMNYSISDISTYFLTFYAPLFLLAVFGFIFAAEMLWQRTKKVRTRIGMLVVLCIAVPVSSIATLPADTVQNANRFARDFASELLRTLPDHALVLQVNWDIQSPCLYLQNVEGLRPDVVMLNLQLLERSWYVRQQVRQHADVFAGCETEIASYLREVAPFEAGRTFDANGLEVAYVAMTNCVLEHQSRVRPVYLRDAAWSGHPDVGARFPQKAGAYFARLSTAMISDPVLDAATILGKRTVFNEGERRLLNAAALAAVQQGRAGLAVHDTLCVRQSVKTASALSPNAPGVRAFVREAGAHRRTDKNEWLERFTTLRKSRHAADAFKFLDSLIAFRPDDPELWKAKAMAEGEERRYEESLRDFNKLLSLQPDSAYNYAGRGLSLEGLKRYEEALADFDRCTQLAPDAADYYDRQGVILAKVGRYDDALKSYDKAVELDSKHASAMYNRACAYALQGEKSKALAELKKAIDLNISFKEMAPKDEDFKSLWSDAEFKKIMSSD